MKGGCKVKICGITSVGDRNTVADLGADFFGVIFDVSFSPRSQTLDSAINLLTDPPIPGIVLVYDPDWKDLNRLLQACRPYGIQFLSPAPQARLASLKKDFPELALWQSLHLPEAHGAHHEVQISARFGLASLLAKINELRSQGIDLVVLDTVAVIAGRTRYGGTGRVSDWSLVRNLVTQAPLPIYLAGGINPGNVREALSTVNPAGIDLCSGVESSIGYKDPLKVRDLLIQVRQWEEAELHKA